MSDTDEVSSQTLLRQQIVLAKFGEFALRSNNLDKILNEACRLVGEALGTDLAKVMELQEDGLTLSVRAGVGWKPDVVGVVTLKTGSHTSEGHALATGEPVISPNIATETRFKYPAFLTDNGVKAVANVIIIGGKDRPPFGIIQIDSREPREFTENNLVFLKSYANLLAAAVDRLRVVDETRNGQVKLDIALAASEMGSWEVNLRTGLAICTPRFKEIFGYANSSRDWMFDTFLDHVIPDDRAHVEAAFRNTVASGNECRFECRIRHETTGETRFIEMRGGRIGDRRPQPCNMHIIGIITDITHRVRAEERNRQSQR
ncbi:MAG: GAF domain-containing protein, partial [Janthinobacterium lividum]